LRSDWKSKMTFFTQTFLKTFKSGLALIRFHKKKIRPHSLFVHRYWISKIPKCTEYITMGFRILEIQIPETFEYLTFSIPVIKWLWPFYFRSGFQMVYKAWPFYIYFFDLLCIIWSSLMNHSITGQICLLFKWSGNAWFFLKLTDFNTRLLWYSDPHCIKFAQLFLG
jgi:hypothetical protein